MRTDEGAVDAADTESTYVAQDTTFRTNPDGSTEFVVQVTRRSTKYGVVYTWFIKKATWDADGGPPLIALKTGQVNAICGYDHVQGFRTEQDQGRDDVLYNFAVITVGTENPSVTDEARVRMDHIGDPLAFAAIDATWKRLAAAGAV